jgi:hypothetical protein
VTEDLFPNKDRIWKSDDLLEGVCSALHGVVVIIIIVIIVNALHLLMVIVRKFMCLESKVFFFIIFYNSTFLSIQILFVFRVKLCIYISSLRIMIGVVNYYCLNDTSLVFLSFNCVYMYSLFPFGLDLWAVEKHVNKKEI